MADQTVRIANDAGSKERVAYDLMEKIIYRSKDEYKTKQAIIDLYVDCLWATTSLDRNGGR